MLKLIKTLFVLTNVLTIKIKNPVNIILTGFFLVGDRSELSNQLREDLIRIIEWEFTLSNSI